jgi:hypothetical protein
MSGNCKSPSQCTKLTGKHTRPRKQVNLSYKRDAQITNALLIVAVNFNLGLRSVIFHLYPKGGIEVVVAELLYNICEVFETYLSRL